MTTRPTVTIATADGKPSGSTHPLPAVFSAPIRPDIVQSVPFSFQQILMLDEYWKAGMANNEVELSIPGWPRINVNLTRLAKKLESKHLQNHGELVCRNPKVTLQ